MLLLEPLDAAGEWEGLARPTRKLRPGQRLGPVELIEHLGRAAGACASTAIRPGEAPLPPYITEPLADPERYQTVYADREGSAAAPTAGLHFTPELLARLDVERVTLHVGLDTFRPVTADDLDEHVIHTERYDGRTRGVGAHPRAPTACWRWGRRRSACSSRSPPARRSQGRTDLFITPPFEFRRTDALLTNFHLPGSTLLALVMAFAGVEETLRLYEVAIEERYRFYSFGDAMLILDDLRVHESRRTSWCKARAGSCSARLTVRCGRPRSCPSGRRRPSRCSTQTRCARSARRSSSATRTTCTSARART